MIQCRKKGKKNSRQLRKYCLNNTFKLVETYTFMQNISCNHSIECEKCKREREGKTKKK